MNQPVNALGEEHEQYYKINAENLYVKYPCCWSLFYTGIQW
jgi:hypothetical protein